MTVLLMTVLSMTVLLMTELLMTVLLMTVLIASHDLLATSDAEAAGRCVSLRIVITMNCG